MMLKMFHAVMRWLFKDGNEFTSITGGWAAYAWSYNTTTDVGGSPGVSNDGTRLNTSLANLYNSGISGVIRIGNMIDLTNVSTLKMRISGTLGACDTANEGYQEIYLFTRQNASGNWNSGNTAQSLVVSHVSGASVNFDGDYSLNVASLTGNHYLCIGIRWKKQNEATTLHFNNAERSA